MTRTVTDLMTQPVTACRPWDSLNDAAHLMWLRDCGCVPVVDDAARLVGMLTDRDICLAAHTRGGTLAAIPIGAAMSRVLASCRPDDELGVVHRMMAERRVRRIPVVDDEGVLVGIVSLCDLARAAAPDARDSLVGVSDDAVLKTLACISTPTWGSADDDEDDLDGWEDDGGPPTGVWARVGEH